MMNTNDSNALLSYEALNHLSPDTATGRGIHWATLPSEELPVRLGNSSSSSQVATLAPRTVMQVFAETTRLHPSRPALNVYRDNRWLSWSYAQYYAEVQRFAKAVLSLHVQPFQGISILGFNSPEWVIANMGAITAGCLPAGIYSTNGPEAVHYVADHCQAAILVVENEEQLAKVLQIKDRLPHLKAIVQWSGDVASEKHPGLLFSWNDFLTLGDVISDARLVAQTQTVRPGHCCTLIYTSGTTGNPKAVMISHDNITWTAKVGINILFGDAIDLSASPQRLVSYLPLSHIAAQIVDVHGPLTIGACVYFAQPDALKGSLIKTLAQVRPTQFLGVPRVWEKIEDKMRAVGAANTGLKKKIGDWAKEIGLAGSYAKLNHQAVPWGWTVADKLVFQNVKKSLGLDQCSICFTAAAPIGFKTLEYFLSLDTPLMEVYGMSESTGPHTVNIPADCKVGTVGKTMDGCETKILADTGEICMRGRHVFMGYLFNEDATRATIDADGWLHSGDIGRLDQDGFLSITGRIKELIITAGGENVAPVLIEEMIKQELPAVSNVIVIGDQQKFLSCLLTLRSEVDAETGQPTQQLSGLAQELVRLAGSPASTIAEMLTCAKIREKIEEGVGRANAQAISRAQQIRKWTLLAGDFSMEGGELTPTMKLKRRAVHDKFAKEIASMYAEDVMQSVQARL